MRIGATNKKPLSSILFLLLAFSILCAPLTASAQAGDAIVIEMMRVDIWPEYDRPSVLVILHITLSAETTLPTDLAIRLPAAVGEPHAVAMQDPNGLYNLNYEINKAGEWEEILFQTPVPDVRIEYYDPGLVKNGAARSYTFNWPGDYTINNLSLQVQQPAGAANVTIKPAMGAGVQAEDGLTYYTYLAGKADAGTTFAVSMTYDKESDTLTSEGQFQTVEPSQPINEGTSGRVNLGQVLPWALGGIGVLLIAAGIFWFFRPGRSLETAPQRHHARRVVQAKPNDELRQDGVFCHQCGKRAAEGDAFCRACGTKLR